MVYKFRSGYKTQNGNTPEAVFQRLEELRVKHGGKLQPPVVVEDAKPEGSLFHDDFTWNNEVCGEQYRLWEARQLIKSVVVIRAEGEEPRAGFVTVERQTGTGEKAQYYQNLSVLVPLSSEFQSAFRIAVDRLKAAERAVNELKRIAEAAPDKSEVLAVLLLATEALSTANAALARVQ